MKKIITYNFKKFNTIGYAEINSVKKVLLSGKLSGFLAGTTDEFYGGVYVKKFESKIKKYFKVNYAITVNSWTSGLIIALRSINLKRGDEVILPAWTMSACFAAVQLNGLKSIFCDINPDNYTLDIGDLKKKISKKTKAILAVDLFGMVCDYKNIFKLTKKRKIIVISDSAQAIGAKYNKKFSSTFVDIGGYSLNRHKHINTGEGGVIVTNNKKFATRCQLLRNHAESSAQKKFFYQNEDKKLVGYNCRLGEIEAAVGIEQLKKLNQIIINRKKIAKKIYGSLDCLQGLIIPKQEYLNRSVFYYMPFRIDNNLILTKKKDIIKMLTTLGLQGLRESCSQLNRLSFFDGKKDKIQICKISEEMNRSSFFALAICSFDFNERDIKLIVRCFFDVWKKIKFKNCE
jgi:dTDP-4-amino-4,6-dideoxygalactose transaminase